MRGAILMLAAVSAGLLAAGCTGRAAGPANAAIARDANSLIVSTAGGTAQVGTDPTGAPMPGDLPPYPNAVPGAAASGGAPGSGGRVVMFVTSDQPTQVLDFYTSAGQQAGMHLLSRTSTNGVASLAFMNGTQALSITATGTSAGTRVQIASVAR